MITDHPTAIEDIVNTFQNQQMPNVGEETQSWILMEILGAIPEEVIKYTYFTLINLKKNTKIIEHFQSSMMYSSVQRVAIQNEICKRTLFVINTVQQFISTKLEVQNVSDADMSTLLRAVKCVEAWLK